MTISGTAVHLSTLLMEKNRWNGKGPSLLVSEWIEPIGEAGFAGVDLWMNHLRFASRSEWDLIKEMSVESDLNLAFISAAIPSDNSDKSQRLRDAVLEACDFFRPHALKFSLAEPGRTPAPLDQSLESLEFVKTWSQDLHREVDLCFDPDSILMTTDSLAAIRAVLSGNRFKTVLHPFLQSKTDFESVLTAAGDFLTNLAVQAFAGKERILLKENAEEHASIISAVRGSGFKGSWTLCYTKGVGLPGEDMDDLFDNAENDLNFLIDTMARTAKRGVKKKG